jgi:biotin transport system substrate-specific component
VDGSSAGASAVPKPQVLGDLLPGTLVRDAILVLAGAALVGLCAQVSVPLGFTPVPLTLQTFGVLLTGATLGWRRGLVSLLVYAGLGVAGLPWFAGHAGGPAILAGPLFGYILAYPVAAALIGWLASRGFDRNPLRTAAAMIAGSAVIYAGGLSWLMVDLNVGLVKGLSLGVTPFLPGDAIKAVAAALILPASWAGINHSQLPPGPRPPSSPGSGSGP